MSHVYTARPRSQASPAAAVALDFGLRVRVDGHAPQRTLFSGAENLSLQERCSELGVRDAVVVVDEVQRLPELLDEVHRLIEERGVRFLLTGSSARKLRRGGVNLLGGRARTHQLYPLTCRELRVPGRAVGRRL